MSGFNSEWRPASRRKHCLTGSDRMCRCSSFFMMPAAGEHRYDEALGVWSNGARPAFKSLRRPFGHEPMGAGHVVQLGAGARPAVAALMNGDALGPMEDLDDAVSHAHFHLLLEQGVRHPRRARA